MESSRTKKRNPLSGKTTLMAASAAVLAASLMLAGCAGGEEGQRGEGQDDSPGASAQSGGGDGWPVDEVAAAVGASVVQVNVETIQTTPSGPEEGQGVGSGVIYREDGYIITNNHVVEGATDDVNVAFADGSVEVGEVVGTDPYTDLAVVRVDRDGLPAAEFGDSRDPALGELAVALGSPSGFQSTVTSGVISGLNREVPATLTGGRQETALVDLIQTDAAISPGSSGGALTNAEGEVVGINVAYLPPTQTGAVNIGFAIPSDTAQGVADQLIEDGEATQPYLGVSLTNLTPETAERFDISVEAGALVTEVDPDSPAAEAGIEPPAVVTAVEGEEVRTTGDLLSSLRQYRPGDTVEVTVTSDGEAREVTIELGERDQ